METSRVYIARSLHICTWRQQTLVFLFVMHRSAPGAMCGSPVRPAGGPFRPLDILPPDLPTKTLKHGYFRIINLAEIPTLVGVSTHRIGGHHME